MKRSPASAVMDGNVQYPVAEMTVNESQESGQPLLVRRWCVDFGKDDLAQTALKIHPARIGAMAPLG
jgi:hypothetical protein